MNRKVNLKMKYYEMSDNQLKTEAVRIFTLMDEIKQGTKTLTPPKMQELEEEGEAIANELEARSKPRVAIPGKLSVRDVR